MEPHSPRTPCSGVRHVHEVFLWGGAPPVPTAGAIAALDAGKLPGLVPTQAVVQQPVRPQALVLRGGGARNRVACGNFAVAAHLISVVEVFLLGQREVVPGFNEVAQSDGDLPVIPHAA